MFNHYAELFEEIVSFAQANGTFDEGVTDIKAVSVRLSTNRVVHRDESSGAETTHYTLEIDQPTKKVSFAEVEEARICKGGAFFEHLRKHSFVLALESGRHTDPETGNSYRNFAVCKPEGARLSYIRDAALTEKYRPVAPENARDWWTAKYAAIPDIQTSKLHIIGGAITPLWQSLKTTNATHLRVVRVTADDGQRIVGVQISSDQVGEVLRALGVTHSLREPSEVFNGVLLDGEEVTLTAGLKLKRGSIHREPAIELCGAHPTMFAALRKLGLINEQISFKQRFFVPTEEEPGTAILAALLERFPVIATEAEEADCAALPDLALLSENTMQPVDLETWIIEAAEPHHIIDGVVQHPAMPERESEPTSDESEPRCMHPNQSACLPVARQASAAAMLQTLPADYRMPAIQTGFNFAESES